MLPDFLRRQLEVGENLSRQMESEGELAGGLAACLDREANWVEFYAENMREGARGTPHERTDLKKLTRVASAEAKFGEALWNRNYERGSSRPAGKSE